MGMYLTFNFVKKNNDFIVGHLPTLGVYESKLKIVEKNYEKEDSFSFIWGGYIFTEFQTKKNKNEYYSFDSDNYYLEFANIQCSTNTKGYDEMSVFLFDISVIKNGIENIVKYASYGGFDDEEKYQNDLVILDTFLDKLSQYENQETLVLCMIG